MSDALSFFTPLQQWLNQDRSRAVAINNGELFTGHQLFVRVCEWTDKLAPLAGQRFAVYSESSVEFLSISLALWQLKKTVCVPNDNQRGTVQRLHSEVDGFIGDFDLSEVILPTPSSPTLVSDPNSIKENVLRPPCFVEMATDFVAVEIYTSGSTGEPKSIQKTLTQLNDEMAMLEQQWPSEPHSFVLSTVTHHHAYGMIFRLLWPFCSSRVFADELSEFLEELALEAANARPFTLVSSPAHLGRLGPSMEWPANEGCCINVFTAAAPLKRESSLEVTELLRAPVYEIYGSSETGAIAWRIQHLSSSNALWRAFAGVQIVKESDDAIRVRGPAFGSIRVPDRVTFIDDVFFELHGRSDQIAKVEGKRISLTAMEQRLQAHSLVQEVKALVIKRQRDEVVCVIELTPNGQLLLQNIGKRSLSMRLKAFVASHFERVVLPRRWRFVEAMPVNSQGKLPIKILKAMFDENRQFEENEKPEESRNRQQVEKEWPIITSEYVENLHAEVHCQIPPDLIYFDGHFDQNPILPGITQIHWAQAIGQRLFSTQGQFSHLEAIKFQNIIQPNCAVVLALTYHDEKQKLTFKYTSEQGVHSSGRICFQ